MSEKEIKQTETTEVKTEKTVKKERPYKLPNPKKKMWSYGILKVVIRMLNKKPQIINLAGEIEDKSIILVNHSAKSGPPALDVHFPKKAAKWGAHQMLDYFPERKAYLRDILYIQKLGKKPGFGTSFKATLMAMLNLWPYKGMWMVPTYPDGRLMKTLRYSTQLLDQNVPIMVFPENSNEGYKDVLTEFFPGFVMLAEKYYRAKGIDLPVYPCYYSLKKRILIIDKPMYVQDMVKEGLTREQIAQRYCDAVNALYYQYVADKDERAEKTEDTQDTQE